MNPVVADVAADDFVWVTVLNGSGFSLCSTSLNKDMFLSS
jgi:hypothetical protein